MKSISHPTNRSDEHRPGEFLKPNTHWPRRCSALRALAWFTGSKREIPFRRIFILWLTIAAGFAARGEIPAGWSTNFAATLSAAESAQQPALAYFTASWCGPCKLMSRLTLTDPAIMEAITKVERVAVDIDEHPDLAAKHHVSAVPTFILLSAAEDETDRTTGFQASVDFLKWLTNSIFRAKEALVHAAVTKKELSEVDQLLNTTETNSIQLATVKLFDLCDERNMAVVRAADNRLKIIAARDPAALLAGLGASPLATRIQVANALRIQLGEVFDIDPWSDAVSRQKKITAWRVKLSKSTNSTRN